MKGGRRKEDEDEEEDGRKNRKEENGRKNTNNENKEKKKGEITPPSKNQNPRTAKKVDKAPPQHPSEAHAHVCMFTPSCMCARVSRVVFVDSRYEPLT